ncbi:MAG: cell division protein ZapA [Deltaproteobacteria bacterium]|nr:cell division protein ZapA [Deltaproteobacteria bacterium]
MQQRITIRGRQYTVKTDEDDVDIQEVARTVDEKMEAFAKRATRVDDYTIAMLVALNLASDLARLRREVAKELEEADRQLASAEVLLSTLVPEEG